MWNSNTRDGSSINETDAAYGAPAFENTNWDEFIFNASEMNDFEHIWRMPGGWNICMKKDLR